MLLDRIDIDAHGPLRRVELGPFAEHLNVVCGPESSGKSAIARFIRDSLVDRDYPLGMLSSSTGRVVWADRNGLLHCRREKDGTATGRRTTQFESRGDVDRPFESLASFWLSGVGSSTDSSRAARSLQLPESIVDGVITDTAVTSVARVISACVRSGLDSHETYRALPLDDESIHFSRDGFPNATDGHAERRYHRDRRLREQLADVEAELAKSGKAEFDDQALVARRDWLSARLVHEESRQPDWMDRDAMVAELRRIDDQLASSSRRGWLRTRRRQLLDQLRVVQLPADTLSPLADAASRWLLRLSAGRLQRIDWPLRLLRENPNSYDRDTDHRTGVTINGRDETQCPAADRALAVMAVRMAAGDVLARTGRQVPLVLETHREMFGHAETSDHYDSEPLAYFDHGHHSRSNHPIAAALRDYSRSGRQVILLTSNQGLTAQLARVGARTFQIDAERIVHAHRPLWRPHYEPEQYVGPHPHTYGPRDADEVAGYYRPLADSRRNRRSAPAVDINRDFDMAWREAYGFYDNPERAAQVPTASGRTDWARDGVDYRDGYYFADAYTTVAAPHAKPRHRPPTITAATRVQTAPSPFYLSVDSPIDQAPSIDAVAAARLRGLGVTHINHLMQQDTNRLADALGLASVEAATIRRWKSECRLVCRVPQLRGFDARVLVGCGVTTPAQLASIHPVDLLQEVEAFLATERGQQVLLSGSSRELSRITSWIAAANCSSDQDFVSLGDTQNGTRRARQYNHRSAQSNGRDRSSGRRSRRGTNATSRRSWRTDRSSRSGHGRGQGGGGEGSSNRRAKVQRTSSGSAGRRRRRSTSRPETRSRDFVRYEPETQQRDARVESDAHEYREFQSHAASEQGEFESEQELRFYLHRDSPVVDAPSIGSRMAERLNAVGSYTVDDLLSADPATVASELDHRRVDPDTVLAWQQQATLVCCVPMLRGHDAQLLVAAEVTTPEELAVSDPEELFGIIDPIARSSEGKRIIRGGRTPDLQEVTDWINYAQHQRELRAA